MRIGLIVDGRGEVESFPLLMERIDSPNTVLGPRYADIQPYSSAQTIAEKAKITVESFVKEERVDCILVIFDHEKREECVPAWRAEVENALVTACADLSVSNIQVVIKNKQFENWLLSHRDALPQKFNISENYARRLYRNNADSAPAMSIIKASAPRGSYHKVRTPIEIMKAMDPYEAAQHSRSFRRFLRLLGCPAYQDQSKNPARTAS